MIKNDFKLTLEAIKNAASCVAIASNVCGLPVKNSGDRCPSFIHSGSNPSSCIINDDYWYSFSDAQGGDVIDLLALYKYDGDRGQAINFLSEHTGIPLPNNEYSQKWHEYSQNLFNKIETWHRNLADEHREYLHNRKINDETIDKLKIGFKFDENRLIIPMWKNGYVCYYCGRTMGEVTKTNPKYKKPYLDGFNENSVFGLDTLNRDKKILVIAEGAFDYLSFYQEGYATIANAGGTYSREQTKTIMNIAKNFDSVLLTFDNDKSGNGFTLKMAKQLFTRHIPFRICNLPLKYKDISEYYCDGGNLEHLIDGSSNGIKKMCQLFKNEDEFEEFIINNRRFIKNTDIIAIFDIIIDERIFPNTSKEWLKEVKKSALRPLTDDEIADIVLNKYKFINNPSIGIMEYNSRYWKKVKDEEVKRYIRKEMPKVATNSRLNSVLGIIKAEVSTDLIPNEKPLINFINGTFEIETGILREHRENDFLSYELPYPYKPGAKSADWDRFITSLFDDPKKIQLLQEYSGYILFPKNIMQNALYLVGNGANGKSVYLNTLRCAFGGESNVSNVELTAFNDKFRLINLMGKLINISNETKADSKGAETNFKSVVAGDPIQGCYKGKDFIDFKPRCKLFFGCNELPKSRDLTDGFTRRMLILKFPYKFTDTPVNDNERLADKNIESKLQTRENLSGIFNWIYDGYKKIRKTNKFTIPDDQKEQMEEYKETQNPIILFTKEFEWKQLKYYDDRPPVFETVDKISNQELYELYSAWSFKNGYTYKSNMRAFKKEFLKYARIYRNDVIEYRTSSFRGIKRHS